MSEDARKKLSEKAKGRKMSEETRQKMHESGAWQKGRKLNLSPEQHEMRSKIASERNKGRNWYTNGKINKFVNEAPIGDEWTHGYTRKSKMK